MTDYTPTTEEVRQGYVSLSKLNLQDPYHAIVTEWFDRWLAEVKAEAIYNWVRLVQGKDNFTMDNARSFIDTMHIAEGDD